MSSSLPHLSPPELVRYARHLTLPDVGVEGQRRLKAAKVLLIGAGGLGSPAALYLAAAGVGTIGMIDFDVVDATNLQRQILHGTADIGRPKLDSARDRLADLNPYVTVVGLAERLTAANALEQIRPYDIVVDGSDNFPTRYLVNDACVLLRKPLVYGSILRFDGQVSLFDAAQGPCYRCLFAEPPPPDQVPSCAEGGVLGVLPGIVGSLQALEAIKWILGVGESLLGRLLIFDALRLRFREVRLRKDPDCPACGTAPSITELVDYEAFCGVRAAAVHPASDVEPVALGTELSGAAPPYLLDVREPWEHAIVALPDAHLIPLGQLPARLAEVPADADIVTYCHHGLRSLQARSLLLGAGFGRVRSLAGGIDAWASDVEPGMVRY